MAGVDVLLIAHMVGSSVAMVERVYGHCRNQSYQEAQAGLDRERAARAGRTHLSTFTDTWRLLCVEPYGEFNRAEPPMSYIVVWQVMNLAVIVNDISIRPKCLQRDQGSSISLHEAGVPPKSRLFPDQITQITPVSQMPIRARNEFCEFFSIIDPEPTIKSIDRYK